MTFRVALKGRFYLVATLAASLAGIILGGLGCATINPDAAINDFKMASTYPPVTLTPAAETTLRTLAQRANLVSSLGMGMAQAGVDDLQPQIITDGLRQALGERFHPAAGTAKTGLVMVFDARATLGNHSGATTSLELTGTFKDGEQVIETVTGTGSATVPYPAFTSGFHQAAQSAFAEFSGNLQTSRKLIAYTSSNVVAAPAPVIATPVQSVSQPVEIAAPAAVSNPSPATPGGNSVYTLVPSAPLTNSAPTSR